jgi:hypothetical protein
MRHIFWPFSRCNDSDMISVVPRYGQNGIRVRKGERTRLERMPDSPALLSDLRNECAFASACKAHDQDANASNQGSDEYNEVAFQTY